MAPRRESHPPLSRAEGELLLTLLEQPESRIIGSVLNEIAIDGRALVRKGALQPAGTASTVYVDDETGPRFADLDSTPEAPAAGYFGVHGRITPKTDDITYYQLDRHWWLRWLTEACELVDAGRPTELVPDHAWDLGSCWVSSKSKVPVIFARRVHGREVCSSLAASLDRRAARSGGMILTSTRNSRAQAWPGGHVLRSMHEVLIGSDTAFEIDRDLLLSPYEVRTRVATALVDLSPDDRVLTIGGEKYVFGGQQQQRVLRLLIDAHNNDRRVPARELFSAFSPGTDTLRKAFKGNKNWPKLRHHLRQERGMCWIEI